MGNTHGLLDSKLRRAQPGSGKIEWEQRFTFIPVLTSEAAKAVAKYLDLITEIWSTKKISYHCMGHKHHRRLAFIDRMTTRNSVK